MYTLLVADDEEIECCGITNVIMECFPQITVVGSAHNGAELIKAAREHRPDIIIADINMPGMNGLEAAEVLRRENINSKLIINTAYSYFEYAKKAILLKAADYLLKPIEKEMFCQTIERVLKVIDQERSEDQDNRKDKERFQKMLDVAGKEVLSSVIMGTPNVEELNMWLENMGILTGADFLLLESAYRSRCRKIFSERYTRCRKRSGNQKEPFWQKCSAEWSCGSFSRKKRSEKVIIKNGFLNIWRRLQRKSGEIPELRFISGSATGTMILRRCIRHIRRQ